MNLIDQLLTVCGAYTEARGLSRSRVSTIVFNDGKIIDRLLGGTDITVGRLETAMRWFSDNWPADTAWPEGIARPAPRPEEAA